MKIVCPVCESKEWRTTKMAGGVHTIKCDSCGWIGEHGKLLVMDLSQQYIDALSPNKEKKWWYKWGWKK
jgi:hypothetical protein